MSEFLNGWRLPEAKQAKAAGVIVGYVVEQTEAGWLLRLNMHSALPLKQPAYLIDYRGRQPRVFSSPATALRNAGSIGFDVSRIAGGAR